MPDFSREQHYKDRIAALVLAYEEGLAKQAEIVAALQARITRLEGEANARPADHHDQ